MQRVARDSVWRRHVVGSKLQQLQSRLEGLRAVPRLGLQRAVLARLQMGERIKLQVKELVRWRTRPWRWR